jgi:N-acetylneuraminic acid mutarotase
MNRYPLPTFIALCLLVLISIATSDPTSKMKWWKLPESLSWTQITSLSVATTNTCGAYLNNKFYVICGYNNASRYSHAQIWDGASWSISTVSHPGGGVDSMYCCVWNNKIVTSPGRKSIGWYSNTTVYDPIANTWISSTPSPSVTLDACSMASVSGEVYMFGGYDSDMSPVASVYRFVPGDTSMMPRTPLPYSNAFMPAAAYGGKIYLFGGDYYGSNILEYNPSDNSFITKDAHLSADRVFACAATIGSKIYIFGGDVNGQPGDLVEIYDPITDTITTSTPMPYTVWSQAGAGGLTSSTTGVLYEAGGEHGYTITGDACRGNVTGILPDVEPTSLGNLKALYH